MSDKGNRGSIYYLVFCLALSFLRCSKYDLTTFKENTCFKIPSDQDWTMAKRNANRRGRSRARRDTSEEDSEAKPAAKTTAMKFAPITPGKDNQSYATVRDVILRKLQKERIENEDVVTSLKAMTILDLDPLEPALRIADDADEDLRTIKQASYIENNKDQMNTHEKRRRNLQSGMKRAYSTIFDDYCTKSMQQRIETHPDFATRIDDNPIVLLQEIQKLMHETVRAQYGLLTVHHAIKGLVTMKQKDDEELLDFVKRFKQTRSTYRNYMGAAWFDHHSETTEE